jgi:riboflavin synthase
VFTGIVEELGEVAALDERDGSARLAIRGPGVTSDAARGDSIAVNGVCLTVTSLPGDGVFTADVMGETLRRTGLGELRPGDQVNLERPLRFDGRLDGHLVQGHVDGTGTITARTPQANWDVVRIEAPAQVHRYLIEKGSVTVDGISLTVSAASEPDPGAQGAGPPWFEVSLIPETLARTTLGRKQPGATVNLEADMIAKYVEKLVTAGARP